MASGSPPPPAPRSRTTILSLGDDLLREIFLRLPSLPSLVRAALAAAPSSPPPAPPPPSAAASSLSTRPLSWASSSTTMSKRWPPSGPSATAAVRGADFFLTCVPGGDDDSTRYCITECRGGFLSILNNSNRQIAVYSPHSRALDLFPLPPNKTSSGYRGKCVFMDMFLLSSAETPRPFRVVFVFHDKSRLRAAVFSSGTREWQILPRSKPTQAQPSSKKYRFLSGRQVNGTLYWSHSKEAYMVMLDTKTMQFSFIDLPEHFKEKGHLYVVGEAKDGRPCIVSAADFTLSIWFWKEDADGVEKWMLDSVIPLEEELLGATKVSLDDHRKLKVLAVLDGIVYLSTFETIVDATIPCWYLFYCLETRKLGKIFLKKDNGRVLPYVMAWPSFLLGFQDSTKRDSSLTLERRNTWY